MLNEAHRQASVLKETSLTREKEKTAAMISDIESSFVLSVEKQSSKLEEIKKEESKMMILQKKLNEKEAALGEVSSIAAQSLKALESSKAGVLAAKQRLVHDSCSRLGLDIKEEYKALEDKFLMDKNIEVQRLFRGAQENLNASLKKTTLRLLDKTTSRYSPTFLWPKRPQNVDIEGSKIVESFSKEDNKELALLSELSGTSIVPSIYSDSSMSVRFVGGGGIYREAAKNSLEQYLASKQELSLEALYKKNCKKYEREAEFLGAKAVKILKLDGIHLEIQKLVGALNWRTSYRQNQWHHTVEVAQLCGILANELGTDSDEAKRVGLLHDVGKAIDYRIEGSHAVISGDYADRYGESRDICDAVMSHHADLLVESPLAYILQTADTLSGARPGARVNLEEGYQIRLSAIHDVVRSFPNVIDLAVMSGGREVHIQVNCKKVCEDELQSLSEKVVKKIEEEVAFPGQIKILISRSFESYSLV